MPPQQTTAKLSLEFLDRHTKVSAPQNEMKSFFFIIISFLQSNGENCKREMENSFQLN